MPREANNTIFQGRTKRVLKLAVTGHRPDRLGTPDDARWVRLQLRGVLVRSLTRYGRRGYHIIAITGLAEGVDAMWAEEAQVLGIEVHAYIPYRGYEHRYWPEDSRHIFDNLLRGCSKVIYVCKTSKGTGRASPPLKRNIKMCADSDGLVAVWDGTFRSGTGHCVRHWCKTRRKYLRINPATKTRAWVRNPLPSGEPSVKP